MSYCPDCGAGMVPLLTSLVCPSECDKKTPRIEFEPDDGSDLVTIEWDSIQWTVVWPPDGL